MRDLDDDNSGTTVYTVSLWPCFILQRLLGHCRSWAIVVSMTFLHSRWEARAIRGSLFLSLELEYSLAWHALPTARASNLLNSTFPVHFIHNLQNPPNKDCEMSGSVKRLWLVCRRIVFRPDSWLGIKKQLLTYLFFLQHLLCSFLLCLWRLALISVPCWRGYKPSINKQTNSVPLYPDMTFMVPIYNYSNCDVTVFLFATTGNTVDVRFSCMWQMQCSNHPSSTGTASACMEATKRERMEV